MIFVSANLSYLYTFLGNKSKPVFTKYIIIPKIHVENNGSAIKKMSIIILIIKLYWEGYIKINIHDKKLKDHKINIYDQNN